MTKNRGFALFYAVLLSSVVLVVSLSLFNITYRQLIISSTIFDSQKSYYVADSGRSCLTYWSGNQDSEDSSFDKPLGDISQPAGADGKKISCFGRIINVSYEPDPGDNILTTTFEGDDGPYPNQFSIVGGETCVELAINLGLKPSPPSDYPRQGAFWHYSSGYNRDCSNLSDPRVTQRSIFSR